MKCFYRLQPLQLQWSSKDEYEKNYQYSRIHSYFCIDFDPAFYVLAKSVYVKGTDYFLHSFMYSYSALFLSRIFAQILYVYSTTSYVDSINRTLPPVPSKSGSIFTTYV